MSDICAPWVGVDLCVKKKKKKERKSGGQAEGSAALQRVDTHRALR